MSFWTNQTSQFIHKFEDSPLTHQFPLYKKELATLKTITPDVSRTIYSNTSDAVSGPPSV